MKSILKILAASLMIMSLTSAKAEIQYGFAIIAGQADVSGTESEGTNPDTSDRSKTIKETFVGGDIFIESVTDEGVALGLSYVPVKIELGSGSRSAYPHSIANSICHVCLPSFKLNSIISLNLSKRLFSFNSILNISP